jgi:phosphotriesterase-related protein
LESHFQSESHFPEDHSKNQENTPQNMSNLSEIQTVLGRIAAADLGATDAHTHLVRTGGPLVDDSSDFRIDDKLLVAAELRSYRTAGGMAVVDMTPSVPGRNVTILAELSRKSGVHVIASTGFVEFAMYPSTLDWLRGASEEEISDLIVKELTLGCDVNNYTGPLVRRIPIKAGVIKIASGYQVINALQKKLIGAAAVAHRLTGAPISAHTESGTCVIELVELLLAQQVAPQSILVAHTFLNPDPGYQRDMAQLGIYLIQDGPGRIKYQPESNSIEQIRRFLEGGYEDQLLFAGDHSRRSYFRSFGGGPGFDYILTKFLPRLHGCGIPPAVTQKMLVQNAARAFSWLLREERVYPSGEAK